MLNSPRCTRTSSSLGLKTVKPEKMVRAIVPTLFALLCLSMLVWLALKIRFPIHDVTTDPSNPVSFIYSPKRTFINNTYDSSLHELQKRFYPDVKPLSIIIDRPVELILQTIWEIARDKMASWELVSIDRTDFRIQAVATVAPLYRDDVVIQLKMEDSNRMTVNVRSRSRRTFNHPDPASNVRHIEALLDEMRRVFLVVEPLQP